MLIERLDIIVLAWRLLILLKLFDFALAFSHNILKRPLSLTIKDFISICIFIILIHSGLDIMLDIPHWSEFTELEKYILIGIVWFFVVFLTLLFIEYKVH